LSNLVSELRAGLGEDARRPRVIRTVQRFGYAFSAAVSPEKTDAASESEGLVCRLVWGRREISIEPGENVIGRDRNAVVWIDHDLVSRRHARISIVGDVVKIEDLGSKNGTYVGGRRIRRATTLADRDVVRIGPAELTLRVLRRTGTTLSGENEGPAR
jgi:FHA domain